MRSLSLRLIAGAFLAAVLPLAADAATTTFGPTAYLQHGDTPAGFACDQCDLVVEDFEDSSLDPFITIDNGHILNPNSMSGVTNSVTDSVDGDDGMVDGNGNGGYSWFTGASNSADNQLTISFASPVKSAGFVITDGDNVSSTFLVEAFDAMGTSLGLIDTGDIADNFFTGETAEDRFVGFQDMNGAISSLSLTMVGGIGIEIDHIHYQDFASCIPEPASGMMALFGLLGIAGFRRRR